MTQRSAASGALGFADQVFQPYGVIEQDQTRHRPRLRG